VLLPFGECRRVYASIPRVAERAARLNLPPQNGPSCMWRCMHPERFITQSTSFSGVGFLWITGINTGFNVVNGQIA
jgi:hypothetical protein